MTTDRRSKQELPEAVKTLIEARTGDAVYVVGPDYTIVHWDQNMESLSGVLSEEALGKPCYETVMGEGRVGNPSVLMVVRLCTWLKKDVRSQATR